MVGSLQSAASLVFEHDADRDRTVLRSRRAGGLCHLSKPYWDGHVLGAQIVNPTAGWFTGDTLEMDVEVGDGARVALTSPSASRFYSMVKGRAVITQTIRVGREAWLEFRPDWTIPQAGSAAAQTTRLEMAEGAAMLFLDLLAPGRVAHGESYRYRRFETRFELRREGRLLARERMVLEPEAGGWPLAVPGWDQCFYGAAWLAGEGVAEACADLARFERERSRDDLRVGFSRLEDDLAVLRVLAPRGLLVRELLRDLRAALQSSFPRLAGATRTL